MGSGGKGIVIDFARPTALLLLPLIVPALLWLARRDARKRAGEWTALGRTGTAPPTGAHAWIGAIALLIVALAGPRWGRGPSDRTTGRDVVFLIDVSRSMAARDAVPDRLGAAVEAAEALLTALGSESGTRAAVVAFAGRGVLRCPLTDNFGATADVLRSLRLGAVRPGGTDLAAGLQAALDAFPDSEPGAGRAIVMLSDGEDLAGAWDRLIPKLLIPKLKERGIPVHTVAVGDDAAAGQPIPLGDDGELTYQGAPVRTRRRDEALAALARETGGGFVPLGLSPPEDLGALFVSRIEPAGRPALRDRGGDGSARYAPLVLAALGVGLIGSWPGRRLRLTAGLALAVVAGAGPGDAGDRGTVNETLRRGVADAALGRNDDALAWFLRAAAREPGNPLAAYDAGCVLFRLGRYAEAQRQYLAARAQADAGLRVKIDFALGNTAFGLGDIPAALGHYDACLASTVPGSDAEATRRDAAANREFVAARQPRNPPRIDEPEGNTPRPRDDTPPRTPPKDATEAPGPTTGSPRPSAIKSAERPPERSPAERLDDALANAREARSRRLSDQPATEADPERKDW